MKTAVINQRENGRREDEEKLQAADGRVTDFLHVAASGVQQKFC